MDRTATIAAAKIYLGRCIDAVQERVAVHDLRARICQRLGGEVGAWHAERRTYLHQLAYNLHHLRTATGAKPIMPADFAKRKIEPTEEQARENREIAELGMPKLIADVMTEVSDPKTHHLPKFVTGDRDEIAAHMAHYAGAKIHTAVFSKALPEQRRVLQQLAARDADPIVRTLAGTFLSVANTCPDMGAERIAEMYVSGLPPKVAADAIAANVAEVDRILNPSSSPAAPAPSGNVVAETRTQSAPAAEPAARSDLQQYLPEWNALSAGERGGWLDFDTFAQFRKHQDRGGVSLVKCRTGVDDDAQAPAPRATRPAAAFSTSQPTRTATAPAMTAAAAPGSTRELAQSEWNAMTSDRQGAWEYDQEAFITARTMAEDAWGKADQSEWVSKRVFIDTCLIEARRIARGR
jgi:hypothetical protein